MVRRLALAAAVMSVALFASQAAGGTPSGVHVSGVYTVTDLGALDCASNGSPFVLRCATTGFVSQYAGTLTGTSVVDFTQVIDCKTSRTVGHGTETFTGSVAGVGEGTLTWRIQFEAAFDCATFAVSEFSARGDVISGTGDLAGLHGSIQFGAVTYEGDLH